MRACCSSWLDWRKCAVSAAEVRDACTSASSWDCMALNKSGWGRIVAGGGWEIVVGSVGGVSAGG